MIELTDFSIGHGGRTLVRVDSLRLEAGSLTALIGRNGSGKSTLLRALAGLSDRYSGRIAVSGNDIREVRAHDRARLLAFVGTSRVRANDMTVLQAVELGRSPYTGMFARLCEADRRIVAESLETVGMEAFAPRRLDTLSDGEFQRAMVARALAQQTPVLMLDEPTSFLDLPNRRGICRLLQRLAREKGKTVLFSTHELETAARFADRLALIDGGCLHVLPPEEMMASGLLDGLLGD